LPIDIKTLAYHAVNRIKYGKDKSELSEKFISRIVSKKDFVMDIGTNTGLMTKIICKYAGFVYGFDPNPDIKISAPNLIFFNCALGAFNGETSFYRNWKYSKSATTKIQNETKVKQRTIDSMLLSPSILFIDAEDSEFNILLGATETIKGVKKVLFEVHGEKSRLDCEEVLLFRGFLLKEKIIDNANSKWEYWAM